MRFTTMILVCSFLLFAQLSLAAESSDYSLDTLDCQAFNGASLKSQRYFANGVLVDARAGWVNKKYIGRISELHDGVPSIFILMSMEGVVQMQVSATIDPNERGVQNVPAYINFTGAPMSGVGGRCHIQIGQR